MSILSGGEVEEDAEAIGNRKLTHHSLLITHDSRLTILHLKGLIPIVNKTPVLFSCTLPTPIPLKGILR